MVKNCCRQTFFVEIVFVDIFFSDIFFVEIYFYWKNFFLENFYSEIFFLQQFFLAIFFLAKFFTNITVTAGICSRWSQQPTFKVWSKSGQWQLRYSWYGQMSLQQLEYVQKGPRNLPLIFGLNRASNSWDIADMDKCRQDKCCMDKCPFDNCLRLSRVNG